MERGRDRSPVSIRRKTTYAWAKKHAADNPDIRAALALPMVRDILDTMDAHRAARFYILTIPQLFKSLLGQLRFMRSRQVEPRSALWYREAKEQLTAFGAEKFNPLFDACRPLSATLYADRTKRKTLAANYVDGTSMALLSAGTKGNRQSRTACDIYMDEPWLYGVGWVGEIQKRRGSYPHDYREIYMSTGPTVDSEADQCWMASDQRTWHVRCPECDELFFPARTHRDEKSGDRIGGLEYETVLQENGLPNEASIAASVKYKCPLCKAVLPNTDATRKAMNGTAQEPRGQYVVTNAGAAPDTFGWHVHAVAVKNWGEIAVKMVKAQLAKERAGDLSVMEELVRMVDAGRWDPDKFMRSDKFSTYQHPTPYKMEEEWKDEIKDYEGLPFRIATIDVQIDRFYLVIRKWGRWSQSRLHFVAMPLSVSEIKLHLERHQVPSHRVFFDTRHDQQRVRGFCAPHQWRCLMGDRAMRDYMHDDGVRRIYDKEKAVDALSGLDHRGQDSNYVIEWIFSKNSALNRLALLRHPDSKAPDGSPLWTAASNAPDFYFKQINAHYPKRVENADGSHTTVWFGQKDDHCDDCEAMIIVGASMVELTGAESFGNNAPNADGQQDSEANRASGRDAAA
jgi:hypothetical protein